MHDGAGGLFTDRPSDTFVDRHDVIYPAPGQRIAQLSYHGGLPVSYRASMHYYRNAGLPGEPGDLKHPSLVQMHDIGVALS